MVVLRSGKDWPERGGEEKEDGVDEVDGGMRSGGHRSSVIHYLGLLPFIMSHILTVI